MKLICTCKLNSYAKKKIAPFYKISEACFEKCMVCINNTEWSLSRKESKLLEYAGKKKWERKTIQVMPHAVFSFQLIFLEININLINYDYCEKEKIALHY